ncbi:TPA: hypothetical protein ACH3X1_010156 [Trebouxia sp. C0004]
MQDLAAENKMLKQALEEKRLMLRTKEMLKAHKKLERLRPKRRLHEAEAENKEKGAAKQEADMRRKAKHQEEMQDEYAKIKNRLKNMDIELHTEARASLCYCQELNLQKNVQLVHESAVAYCI